MAFTIREYNTRSLNWILYILGLSVYVPSSTEKVTFELWVTSNTYEMGINVVVLIYKYFSMYYGVNWHFLEI